MKISRTNGITKTTSTMDIDITPEQFEEWVISKQIANGRMIQDIMPNISAGEREFLMTGITPEQWENMFGNLEEALEEKEISQGNDRHKKKEDYSDYEPTREKPKEERRFHEDSLQNLHDHLQEKRTEMLAEDEKFRSDGLLKIGGPTQTSIDELVDLMQTADSYLTRKEPHQKGSGNYQSLERGANEVLMGDELIWHLNDGGYSRIALSLDGEEGIIFEMVRSSSLPRVIKNWANALIEKPYKFKDDNTNLYAMEAAGQMDWTQA